ncbi:MAG: alanine racemase, partial [Bacteroidales bacterium]|nr:alanine racemase [Bacteroidales bacterium]
LYNIEYMVNKARENDLIFRPHFKTHQSLAVGRWFRQYGVDRITVSSLKMAYYFARDNWKDILVGIAYNPREYGLYEKLAEKCKIRLTIGCPEAARLLAGQCRFQAEVMIKIDTGYNRTGIKWNDSINLNRTIDYLNKNSKIKIRGLMTHDGSTYGLGSREKITEHYLRSVKRINKSREDSGIRDLIVSVGDTPSASLTESFGNVDELRPGNFVFYDLMQHLNGTCDFNNIAMALICPVIDIRPSSGTIVIHGGAVHFSKESLKVDGKPVYGMLVPTDSSGWHHPENKMYISSLSQEHGIIECPEQKLVEGLQPGDLLAVIPVHSCLTADCMGSYTLTSGKTIDHMRQQCQDSEFSL